MVFVVDASVAGAWALRDEKTAPTELLKEQALEFGCHAPLIWPAELEQVLLTAERAGRLDEDDLAQARMLFADMDIVVDVDSPVLRTIRAGGLARRRKLSVYDALYVGLARRLDLPLATLDKRLRTAALAEGVLVLP